MNALDGATEGMSFLRQNHEIVHVSHVHDAFFAHQVGHGVVEGGEHDGGQQRRQAATSGHTDTGVMNIGLLQVRLHHPLALNRRSHLSQGGQQDIVLHAFVVTSHIKASDETVGGGTARQEADGPLDAAVPFQMSTATTQTPRELTMQRCFGVLKQGSALFAPACEEPAFMMPAFYDL